MPLDQLVRLGIGYVPQVDDVFDPLKVSENLSMGGYLLPRGARVARMEEVLAIFPVLRDMLSRPAGTSREMAEVFPGGPGARAEEGQWEQP
ncbi:MAG TPA: hypothetical protein VEC76_11350 [Streptosporangiaceae bacterium]|nr:hypothetical protein [Streptosporangiaceae bacterium]